MQSTVTFLKASYVAIAAVSCSNVYNVDMGLSFQEGGVVYKWNHVQAFHSTRFC